jgi:methylase of polypeptide subunit release factors
MNSCKSTSQTEGVDFRTRARQGRSVVFNQLNLDSMAQKETHFFVGSYVETYESYAFRLTSSFVPDLLHAVDFDGLRSKTSDGRLTILDAAAGTGAVSLALAQKFPQDRIIATDNSPEMLAMLSRKSDAQGVKNVEVVTADLLVRF